MESDRGARDGKTTSKHAPFLHTPQKKCGTPQVLSVVLVELGCGVKRVRPRARHQAPTCRAKGRGATFKPNSLKPTTGVGNYFWVRR